MSRYWQIWVSVTVLFTLAGILGCSARRTAGAPTVLGAGTPAASEDSQARAADATIAAALGSTLTPAPSATETPGPTATATQTPNVAATATAEEANVATRVAATQMALPTATPVATFTWTPAPPDLAATATSKAQQLAMAVAATLTAQPTATPTFTSTPNLAATQAAIAADLATAVAATLTAQAPNPTPTPVAPPPPGAALPLRIVFAYGDVGQSDLRLLDVASGSVRTLAGQTCDEAEPSWSPDELMLLYHANCAGSYDIYQVNSEDGATSRLTMTDDLDEREPDYAPDGNRFVYRVNPHDETKTNDVGELWVMDINGANPISLGIIGRAPAWSPDGSRIAYMANPTGVWNIYVYELDAQRITQLTNCSTNCRWPGWSPDSQTLIYNTTTKANNTVADALWRIPAAGGQPTRLTSGGNTGRPSWSRTGVIAFNSTSGLEVMQANGTGRRLLLANNDNWAPYWSK